MSFAVSSLLFGAAKASFEVPNFGPMGIQYTYSNPSVQNGNYLFKMDVCSSLSNSIVLKILRDGNTMATTTTAITLPSGTAFDRTKFTYEVLSVSGSSGLTQSGASLGPLTSGAVVDWSGSYSPSSLNKVFTVNLRLRRVENPNNYADVTLTYIFAKDTYVDPRPPSSGSASFSSFYINSAGSTAAMSLTFNGDRSTTARAIFVDTGMNQTSNSTWLSSGYTPSDYEAQVSGDSSWTSLPGTVSWASDPATTSGYPSSSSKTIVIRNRYTGSSTTWSVSISIIGPNATALVFPTLTFPTDSLDNSAVSWSFSFNSDGTYTTVYSTPSSGDGYYTSTGRWLREGYSAGNYRFTVQSGNVNQSAPGRLSGSVSGIGGISTAGISFSASATTGVLASGYFGGINASVKIENVTIGSAVSSPTISLSVNKKV